jgi:hypothetical protein
MKFNLQSKLGAWALISLLCLAVVPAVGCNGATAAQDIVNWTPTIVSAATTIDGVIAVLVPQDAALIAIVGTSFTAGANLVDAQAKTYLENPSATALQQLQAQALAFQANVNTALLQAAKISNPASQQKILTGLNAAVTGISAVLALISQIKGSTLTPASVTAPKIAQVEHLMNPNRSIAMIASHYGISDGRAEIMYVHNMSRLQEAGL